MAWCNNLLQFKNSEKELALAICINSHSRGYMHSGIAYKEDGVIRLFHLGFHFELYDQPIENELKHYLFVPVEYISPSKIKLIISLLDYVKQYPKDNNTFLYEKIEYGIKFVGGYFDRQTFKFIPENGTIGLTCSTIILAIFNTFYVKLIKLEEWPYNQPEDIAFHQYILYHLQGECTPEYLAENKNAVGCARFKPEQVVVSGAIPRSAGYNDCNTMGQQLKKILLP